VTVRDGVFWHDGEPLTADDVKFSWDAHMSDIGLEASYITEVVESIEVVDETTVAFNNLQATVDFPIDYLFWFAILPMHIWESVPTQDWITDPGSTGEDPSRVVGTGPFKFQEFVLGDFITLTRNEEYWDGVPHLDQYISQETEDTSAVVSQLLAGEIDFAEDVDPGAVNALDAEQFDIFEIYAGYLAVLIFNLREDKTTLFQDTAVRKAMMYAMNREEMIEAADFGYAEIPLGVMAPGAWMTIPEEITVTYSYDPDQAAALFEEAGWVLGDDGIREKDGQQLAFTILAASGNTREEARLAIVQEQLRQVGVAAEIQTMDGDLLYERTNDTWDFEVVLDYYYMGFTPENSFLWACGADDVGNHAGYCNPEVDQLFDDGRATADREERARIYTQIQNLILEDLPALPLAVPFAIGARNLRTHNMYPAMPSTAHFAAETWWVDA
jgi:peptide/nickel transport system substrate-binding protein